MAAVTRLARTRHSMGGPPPIASLCRIMNTKTRAFCLALAVATCLTSARLPLRAVEPSAASAITAESLKALTWRSIGPAMFAGRVVDVAGIPGRPEILYRRRLVGSLQIHEWWDDFRVGVQRRRDAVDRRHRRAARQSRCRLRR